MTYAIDLTSWVILMWFVGFCLKQAWNSFLGWRDKNFVLSHEKNALEEVTSVHSCAKNFFTQEKLNKSMEYERTCDAFGSFRRKISNLVSIGFLAFGLFPFVFSLFSVSLGWHFIFAFIATSVILSIVSTVISIPFSYYNNFSLEEKFGFNMMTKKTFWTDIVKEEAISFVLSSIMIGLLFGIIEAIHCFYGPIDILAAFAIAIVGSCSSMILEVVQLKVLMPLFNKFTPLEDGELKTRAEDLLKKFGYDPAGVYVMDASRRTRHSNAYCSGWGKAKKLILFDTLLKDFTTDEVIAILGHELAHAKLHHLIYDRALEFAKDFVFNALAIMMIYNPALYTAFGWNMVNSSNVAGFALVGFNLFQKLYDSWSWIFEGVESYLSRLMEFAADKYSCIYTKTVDPMVTSLFKLYGENLSFPLTDPWYEAWNFSHPSLINRTKAIMSIGKECKEQEMAS